MFGGSDPSVLDLVPADITVADNYVTKRLSWRTERWSAKNLIELKNARRVVIARNVFENNWEGGQPGFAIVFTVRNQDGKCTWHASGIVQIDGPPVLGFVFTNNLSTYGSYGIAGTGHGSGNSAIGAYLPGRTSRATCLPGHRPPATRPVTAFRPPPSSRPSSSPLRAATTG